jgi:hypothetical protein
MAKDMSGGMMSAESQNGKQPTFDGDSNNGRTPLNKENSDSVPLRKTVRDNAGSVSNMAPTQA